MTILRMEGDKVEVEEKGQIQDLHRSYQTAGGGVNWYCHEYVDTLDEVPSQIPDWVWNVSPFVCNHINWTWHRRQTDCSATMGQFYTTPFYNKIMKWDQFLHTLCFLQFVDNRKDIDRNDENYDRLRKIWDIFVMISNAYAKYYNPSKHLAEDNHCFHQGDICFKEFIKKVRGIWILWFGSVQLIWRRIH
jgi:hypothetical protein